MPRMRPEHNRGLVLRLQGHEITPVERVVGITWRGGHVEWRRPLAAEVRTGSQTQRIPIHDATRRAVLSLWLAGCAFGALAVWTERIRCRGRNNS